MTLLVVNFHYVSAERGPCGRAIFPVAVEDLVAQVAELARCFEPVTPQEVEEAAAGGRPLPERAFLITFDDGLRAQAELALPALLGLGVVPLFLVPGQPLAERRPLFVHKVHHVRSVLDPAELLRLLEAPLARSGLSPADVPLDEAIAAYGYDEPEEARLKLLLNHMLPQAEREHAIDAAFAEVVADERAFSDELYMPAEAVAEIARAHGAIGAHSYAHRPLALLEPAALRADLAAAAATLEHVTGSRPQLISYPHGSLDAVDRSVADAARAEGFRVGFTMERALNRTLDDPLLLARVDTNDAPGGTQPLLAVGAGGELVVSGRMSDDRTRYVDERTSAGRS